MKRLLLLSVFMLSGNAMELENAKMIGFALYLQMLNRAPKDTYKLNCERIKTSKQNKNFVAASSLANVESESFELPSKRMLAEKHSNINTYSAHLSGKTKLWWEDEFNKKVIEGNVSTFFLEKLKFLMPCRETIDFPWLTPGEMYNKLCNAWIRFRFQNPSFDWQIGVPSSDELIKVIVDYHKLIEK